MGKSTIRNSITRREALKATVALPIFAARGNVKAAVQDQRSHLEKKRPCDGVCCHASPLVPVGDGRECRYHDHSLQFDVNSGCRIMQDAKLLDELTEDGLKRFAEGCVGYPIPYEPTGGFGNCCWRRT